MRLLVENEWFSGQKYLISTEKNAVMFWERNWFSVEHKIFWGPTKVFKGNDLYQFFSGFLEIYNNIRSNLVYGPYYIVL